tara:strand:+ start:165 stop:629 length:465 start_codon:yes stop_codon:yes gene_type:complete
MSKFRKNGKKGMTAISTASLPDIVFMLLFFFMVTTVMRETTLQLKIKTPEATEIKKLQKKSLVSYIYIGKPFPRYQKTIKPETSFQINDRLANVNEIQEFIAREREARDEKEIPYMTTSIKADEDTEMRYVTAVKQELRKANALKINYSTRKGK